MNLITVKITKKCKGSPDPVTTRTYMPDEIVDLPEELANVFVNQMETATVYERKKTTIKKKAAVKKETTQLNLETPEDGQA